MLLSRLPNEILFLIAEIPHLRDLNALARANRSLYLSLNGCLYRRDAQSGSSALFWAATCNILSTAHYSLAAGASLHARAQNRARYTPILEAVHSSSLDVLDLLLSHSSADAGADINAQDRWGQTPLITAVYNDSNEQTIKRLLAYPGIELDRTDNSTVYKHHANQVRDARPHPHPLGEMTALAYAAWYGYTSPVQHFLRTSGINPNSKDAIGRTPLFHAINWEREEVIKQLLAHPGIELNPRDRTNNTPLSYAAFGGSARIVSLLLDKDGIELDAANDDGDTPVDLAAAEGHQEVAQLVLARGLEKCQKSNTAAY